MPVVTVVINVNVTQLHAKTSYCRVPCHACGNGRSHSVIVYVCMLELEQLVD